MNIPTFAFRKSMVVLLILALPSCKFKSKEYSEANADDSSEGVEGTEIELENEDIDLPGPVENLLSLLLGTPVFGDNHSVRSLLKYDPNAGVDPIKAAIANLPAGLSDTLSIEDAGSTTIHISTTEEQGVLEKRFRGVCLNGRVYLLKGVNPVNKDDIFSTSQTSFSLEKVAQMPESYRMDIKGCRSRFLELVNIKYRETAQAEAQLELVEGLNFAFGFIPGYSGAESMQSGNTVLGMCEIVADIATLGAATKFKAGWRTLSMTKRMYRSAQSGFRMASIGSNTARLGLILHKSVTEGASFSEAPSAVLLVAELGFVLTKMKVRRTKLSALHKLGSAAVEVASEAAPLKSVLSKLGGRVKNVPENTLNNLFSGKYIGSVSTEELTRIRNLAQSGGDLGIDDIHKLMTHTSLVNPDTAVNVTANATIAKVIEPGGRYWGYMGSNLLPRGVYATAKPISWSKLQLSITQGSNVQRDAMMVFTGDAVKQFQRVDLEKGHFYGHAAAWIAKFTKTTMKPNNPEIVTKTGDVRFVDFDVFHDGSKSLVVVKKIEILDELHGAKFGSPEYQKLTRIKAHHFASAVFYDLEAAALITAGGAIATILAAEGFEWLVSTD